MITLSFAERIRRPAVIMIAACIAKVKEQKVPFGIQNGIFGAASVVTTLLAFETVIGITAGANEAICMGTTTVRILLKPVRVARPKKESFFELIFQRSDIFMVVNHKRRNKFFIMSKFLIV